MESPSCTRQHWSSNKNLEQSQFGIVFGNKFDFEIPVNIEEEFAKFEIVGKLMIARSIGEIVWNLKK